jgi:hypothetical protein
MSAMVKQADAPDHAMASGGASIIAVAVFLE